MTDIPDIIYQFHEDTAEAIMTFWQQLKQRWGRRPPPPMIPTQWGNVSESARHAAAMNMKHDPEKKAMVVRMIGEAEARRRYPEGWE